MKADVAMLQAGYSTDVSRTRAQSEPNFQVLPPTRRTPAVRRRVVVVEDASDLGQTLVSMLREEGHEAWNVTRWQDAWEIVRRRPPDCVLLDARLHGDARGAEQLLNLMMLNPATQSIPVIILGGDVGAVKTQAPSALPFGSLSILLRENHLDTLSQAIRDTPAA